MPATDQREADERCCTMPKIKAVIPRGRPWIAGSRRPRIPNTTLAVPELLVPETELLLEIACGAACSFLIAGRERALL